MKAVCIAALLMAAVVTSVPVNALQAVTRGDPPKADTLSEAYTFEQYEADFNKHYSSPAERQMRKGLFEQRLNDILSHNRAGRMWKKGVNPMTDNTAEERRRRHGSLPSSSTVKRSKLSGDGAKPYYPIEEAKKKGNYQTELPLSFDWRAAYPAVLTAVKDQGECGNCWAHAATESLESALALKTGQLNVMSQQQITACTQNPLDCGGYGGCDGSIIEVAYDYVLKAGITDNWEYPDTSYWGVTGKCLFNRSTTNVNFLATPSDYYVTYPRNSPEATMRAIQKNPLAILVDASTWDDYESGVFDGCTYADGGLSLDHGVQLVGWGADFATGTDYWIIRNSWGAYWGEAGYIRLYKERDDVQCGPNSLTPPCPGYSADFVSCGQCGLLWDTLFPTF